MIELFFIRYLVRIHKVV